MIISPHPESFIFPPRCVFSKFCGPLASLASLPFYLWPARFARKYLTLDQFTSRDVGRICSERSEQAVVGVWGRSPQRDPGAEPLGGGQGGAAPRKILRNRVFKTTFGIKEICRTAINWD